MKSGCSGRKPIRESAKCVLGRRVLFFFRLISALTITTLLAAEADAQNNAKSPANTGKDDTIIVTAPKPKLAVPPGFESLAEPQTTLIDVYYAGEFIMSQLATFTSEEITLSNPKAIVERIPTLLDPSTIETALAGSQPGHPELVCSYQSQTNCGDISPETVALIFDEEQFRVDLFVNANYLSVQSTQRQKYLPASDGNWSWLQTFNGAAAGSDVDEQNTYSINSNSTLAFRENRLQVTSNYQDQGDNAIDTAVFRRDWRGKEYELGYFRSNSGSFQFMGDSKIRGARIASSLDTREDLRQTAGNDLVVFLGTRSEVSLYKDDRLISTRFYDAGNQVLDTSQLPGGAYDVRIVIRDLSGQTSEETRFYIKSSQLPPSDQALYFVEAGEILDPEDEQGFARSTGYSMFRAGYHSRLTDQIGYMVGASVVESNSALELGLTHLSRYYDLNVGTFFGTDDRRGARMDFRAQFGGVYLNGNYRRIWNNNFDADTIDPSDFVGPSTTQGSIGLTTQLPFGRLELSSRFNRRKDNRVENHTLRYEFPRWRWGVSELYSGIELSREDHNTIGLFTLEMRFNGKHLTGQLRPQYSTSDAAYGDQNTAWTTDGVLSWQDRDLMKDKDLRLDLRGRKLEQFSTVGAEVDFATQSGRLRLQSEQTDNNGASSQRYNGNVFTSFMVNEHNTKLGGREQSQSAILIDVTGDLADATFDVLVDGSPRAVAYPNTVVAINLRPFQTYSVTLRQQGESFVEYDQQPRRVTLYPGNVVTLNWQAAELDIVFGRLLDSAGNAIANALITGVSGLATTDDNGLFQAELRRDVSRLQVETMNASCEIIVPPYIVNKGIGNLGNLSCVLQPK